MKSFFLKLIFLSVTGFLLINLLAELLGSPLLRTVLLREGSEVFDATDVAQLPSSKPEAVFGESVSFQLLHHANIPTVLNLTTNQAISVCGQYLLMRTVIEHDHNLKRITLAYQASCFSNDLNEPTTFNFFVKPFYLRPPFADGIDPLAMERVNRCRVSRLVFFPIFRFTDLLSSTDYSRPRGASFQYLAPVTVDYLARAADLCAAHHVQFRILSTPISTTSGYNQDVFLKEVSAAHLDDLFAGYPQTIRYVDPNVLIDNLHFKHPYVTENSAKFVKMLLENSPARPGP
jgi:hypothetical protein